MAGETVLIIDDSAELRSVLRTILSFGGYLVLDAGTGEEGLALVAEAHPDLIMIDLELPDTNGLRILEVLNERGLTTPTTMMTGYGSEGVAARALRLGVRDYLIKPFTTEEVLSSVDRALAESRLRQEKDRLARLLNGYVRHTKLIAAVGRSIASGLGQDETLQRIVEAGLFAVRAEGGVLLWRDESSEGLRVVVSAGKSRPCREAILAAAGDECLHPVLEQGAVVRLQSDNADGVQLQTGEKVRAALQVPLVGPEGVLGLLSMDRRSAEKPFSEYDEQILQILADYAAMSLVQERQNRLAEPLGSES
jgi:CheY-like chemotaxis protein